MKLMLNEISGLFFDPDFYKTQKKIIPELRVLSENRYVIQAKRRSKFLEKGDFIVVDDDNNNIYVLEKDFIEAYRTKHDLLDKIDPADNLD